MNVGINDVLFAIGIGLVVLAISSIKIVKQSDVLIIERFGKLHKIASAGLTIIIPFIDQVRAKVTLRKQIMDIRPQEVITLDNVSIAIDTVVFFQVTDAAKSVYEIEDLQKGIENLTVSAMRDIIGKMELDQTFSSRDQINEKLRITLDEATDPWGCKVEKVEIKEIRIPADIKDSMEKQMNAERSKRAMLLDAQAEKQSAITIAEGNKEAAILNAEAVRETKIREAAGEAEAIKSIGEAEARKIEFIYGAIKNSAPDEKLVQLEALKTLNEVSKGQANKVFIPFDATKALSSLGAASDIFHSGKDNNANNGEVR